MIMLFIVLPIVVMAFLIIRDVMRARRAEKQGSDDYDKGRIYVPPQYVRLTNTSEHSKISMDSRAAGITIHLSPKESYIIMEHYLPDWIPVFVTVEHVTTLRGKVGK